MTTVHRTPLRFFVVSAVLALSALAWSSDEGYYFDCDVPAGNFSAWHGPIDAGEKLRVSGTVEVVLLRHDKRWSPVGSIFLKDGDDRTVGLQVYVDWGRSEFLQFGMYSDDRAQIAEIELTDEPIPFDFSVTRSGEFNATIAGHSHALDIGPFEARRIHLSCSSGEFVFKNIQASSQ